MTVPLILGRCVYTDPPQIYHSVHFYKNIHTKITFLVLKQHCLLFSYLGFFTELTIKVVFDSVACANASQVFHFSRIASHRCSVYDIDSILRDVGIKYEICVFAFTSYSRFTRGTVFCYRQSQDNTQKNTEPVSLDISNLSYLPYRCLVFELSIACVFALCVQQFVRLFNNETQRGFQDKDVSKNQFYFLGTA